MFGHVLASPGRRFVRKADSQHMAFHLLPCDVTVDSSDSLQAEHTLSTNFHGKFVEPESYSIIHV